MTTVSIFDVAGIVSLVLGVICAFLARQDVYERYQLARATVALALASSMFFVAGAL